MPGPLIEVEGVWFRYPGSEAYVLRGASLRVLRGDFLAVVGENGSGKSTLLMLIAGLLRPERGRVLFEGRDIRSLLPGVRRRLGVVFQDPDDQLFNASVYDEIAYTPRQLGWSSDLVRRRVAELAELLGIEPLLHRHPLKLSYGEKKLVAVAAALAHDPDVLILDEPTAYLSGGRARLVLNLLDRLHREGRTVVAASHDPRVVRRAGSVALLSEGRLRLYGSAEAALGDPPVLDALGLGGESD